MPAHSYHPLTSFAWVDTPARYKALRKQLAGRAIPVVKPTALEHQAEWENILKWYTLIEKSSSEVSLQKPSSASGNSRHLIISIGKKYEDICRFFCDATGRRLLMVKKVKDIRPSLLPAYASVMVVGEEASFGLAAIKLLSEIDASWGIVSGKNFQDVSFFIAKILAADNAAFNRCLFIDAIERNIQIGNHQPGKAVRYNRAALKQVVNNNSWDVVLISAHGEMSHLKLNTSVICGKMQGEGISAKTQAVSCTDGDNGRTCIRVHNRNINIFYIRDFKTKHLNILSCISFKSSSRLAPANVSFLNSIASSYPAGAILTTRNVAFDEELVNIVHKLSVQGISSGFIIDMLNDFEQQKNNSRPFILAGDPLIKNKPELLKLQTGKRIYAKTDTCYFFKLNRNLHKHVIGINASEVPYVLKGMKYLLVYFHKDPGAFRAADMQQEYEGARLFFESVSNKFSLLRAIAENIQGIMDDTPQVGTPHRELFGSMQQCLIAMRQILDVGNAALDSTRDRQVWDDVLDSTTTLLRTQLEKWQAGFCTLLEHDYIFAYIRRALTSNARKSLPAIGPVCDYCSNDLRYYTLVQPTEKFRLHDIICDWCGDREISALHAMRIDVSHSKKLEPGQALMIKIKKRINKGHQPITGGEWHLVVSLFNKSLEKEFYHEYFSTKDDSVIVSIKVPGKLTVDLHALRVFSMYNGEMIYYRSRVSVLRNKIMNH